MIELRALPRIESGMALLTSCRETERAVVRRTRIHVTGNMTSCTIGRKTLKLPGSRIPMAGIAFHQSMRANQRKPVLMIAHRFHRQGPTLDRMTLLALRPHLATMDVGMTIGAFVSDIRKYRTGMALGAGYFLMHAGKRKMRPVVIELRRIADRLPPRKGVTVLARNR